MWIWYNAQSDSPSDVYLRQLTFKWFIGGLGVVSALLSYELMKPELEVFLSQRALALLLMACVVLLVYTISVYTKDRLRLRLVPGDELQSLEVQKGTYYGQWELRKAYLKAVFKWWFGLSQPPKQTFPMRFERDSEAFVSQAMYLDERRLLNRPRVLLRNIHNDPIAADFQKKMKLDGKMDIWVGRIKRWMYQDLLPLVLDSHVQNLGLLNDLLEEFTSSRSQTWVFGEPRRTSQSSLRTVVSVSLQDVQKLALELSRTSVHRQESSTIDPWKRGIERPVQYPEDRKALFVDVVLQRCLLEKYFVIPSYYNTREYVLSRLQSIVYNRDISLRERDGKLGTDLNRLPTDLHILSHIFFIMLNNGNNKSADPSFDLTHEFLYAYPTPPKAASADQVFFYQVFNDPKEGPQYDVISGLEHWVAWSGDDNLFHAIALFLLHVRDKANGRFREFDCRELMHLIA